MIFTATPQGLCSSLVSEEILSKVKIIDLSADFRIKDVNRYEEWYGIKHQSPEFIDEAVYGLCEINREDIKKARLIANPGCYPTRLRILYLLYHREVCVRNIAEAIEMSPPAVSHHLRSLKQLGVITSRRIGKEVHYTIADTADGELVSDLLKTVFERRGIYEEDL